MKESRKIIFLFRSNLAIQIWDSFQQHRRKKDYNLPLICYLLTKISKCKLKIQITSTDHCRSRVHFHCLFRKGKEAQNLFASV